ncbi:uncharacterized protein TRIVIDRAFT_203634 [Trichoderma virens Gv29-8]|uniref:Uncharacterized protein n=1 Tax=Hypocrea virens (strain Gv29-8 / FGSC 10586) TaxID=413071 RepID=G9N183_HYPVG|nr:uncharacterized protein TRIVIDRAFT_203634 [Trichoderma virens Gv29-8]EHK19515.1 hypothetical protein TRIVIDRAFT_203634 [Trichoderma virens Gv29-8]
MSDPRIGDPLGQQTRDSFWGQSGHPQPTRFHTPVRCPAGILMPFQAMGTGRWGETPICSQGFMLGFLSAADPWIGAPPAQCSVVALGAVQQWLLFLLDADSHTAWLQSAVRLAAGRDEITKLPYLSSHNNKVQARTKEHRSWTLNHCLEASPIISGKAPDAVAVATVRNYPRWAKGGKETHNDVLAQTQRPGECCLALLLPRHRLAPSTGPHAISLTGLSFVTASQCKGAKNVVKRLVPWHALGMAVPLAAGGDSNFTCVPLAAAARNLISPAKAFVGHGSWTKTDNDMMAPERKQAPFGLFDAHIRTQSPWSTWPDGAASHQAGSAKTATRTYRFLA